MAMTKSTINLLVIKTLRLGVSFLPWRFAMVDI
jgi:hypothetical protein